MNEAVEVFLWGKRIGVASRLEGVPYAVFAYNPGGDWTSRHQMAVNGKRIRITDDDLLAMAHFANLRERKARAVIDEIKDAVRAWPRFAAEAEVRDEFVTHIGNLLDGRLPTLCWTSAIRRF